MSMYTQLMRAALERPLPGVRDDPHAALDLAFRQRRELQRILRPDEVPEAMAVRLARQVSYDIALMRLASAVGITTDPSRFDEPGRERARLEAALDDLGMTLDCESNEVEHLEPEP